MYEFRNLTDVSDETIAATWNSSFSDYLVPINMSPDGIQAYFRVSGVDRGQSFGAFYQDELVGLLINAVGPFKEKVVAYDAMTGIVPQHRGKGLFSQLFKLVKSSLKNDGITQYYLEVITTNEKAYTIYKKKGGRIVRKFACLNGKMDSRFYIHSDVIVMPLSAFPKENLCNYEPSFANQIVALHRNIQEYQIAYIENQDKKVAVVFKKQGSIVQILWDGIESDMLQAVFTYLSNNFDNLSISNIPATETKLINSLKNIGMKVLVNQYEMCIDL